MTGLIFGWFFLSLVHGWLGDSRHAVLRVLLVWHLFVFCVMIVCIPPQLCGEAHPTNPPSRSQDVRRPRRINMAISRARSLRRIGGDTTDDLSEAKKLKHHRREKDKKKDEVDGRKLMHDKREKDTKKMSRVARSISRIRVRKTRKRMSRVARSRKRKSHRGNRKKKSLRAKNRKKRRRRSAPNPGATQRAMNNTNERMMRTGRMETRSKAMGTRRPPKKRLRARPKQKPKLNRNFFPVMF